MQKVNVLQKFKLTGDDGVITTYEPGLQNMSDEHALHWYTQNFIQAPKPEAEPVPEKQPEAKQPKKS